MVETNFLDLFLLKLIKKIEICENFEKIDVEQAQKPFLEGRGERGAAKFRKIMLLIAISPDLTRF